MEFEEMKKIWDTQNNEPIYAINEQALHRRILKKNVGIKRMANISEWALLFISLVVALVMIAKGILDNEAYKLPQGVLFLMVAGFICWGRYRRIRIQGSSDGTLLGDLEQAIRTIDYHIKRERNFVWWFLLPAVASVVINFFYTFDGKPWWIWPAVIASFVLSYWVVKKTLRTNLVPRKEELESLRNLFIGTNGEGDDEQQGRSS